MNLQLYNMQCGIPTTGGDIQCEINKNRGSKVNHFCFDGVQKWKSEAYFMESYFSFTHQVRLQHFSSLNVISFGVKYVKQKDWQAGRKEKK